MPFKFGVDSRGNYGYIKAGADTVTPFLTRRGNATASHVLSGKTFSNASSSGLRGTMPNINSIDNAISSVYVENGSSGSGIYARMNAGAHITTASSGYPELFIPQSHIESIFIANATPGDITRGKTAYVNGVFITGTRPAPSTLQSGQFSFSSASYEQITRTVYFNPEFDSVPKVTYTLSGGRMSMVSVTPYRTHVIFVMLHSHGNDHHTGTVVWSATV